MPHQSRNSILAGGIERSGRGKAYHNRGVWAKKSKPAKAAAAAPAAGTVTKTVKGGKRTVQRPRAPRFYSAESVAKPLASRQNPHTAKLRASITPGTVLIVLAGKYAGKRVVFLKQLASGLLLVTGPFKINGVPLRRVAQAYVIATSTKVDVSKVAVPEHVNDAYFAKPKAAKTKKSGDQLFAEDKKEEAKKPKIAARVADQKSVDAAVLKAVQAVPNLAKYLKALFSLTNKQYPHKMQF
eukprot:GILI01021657.1.p2 GENE.GILI01021657.1~~GILI01021657.1.p2  ORF type:complete len:240 (-),score=79.87 GILI01021657.1:47-766(-)